VRANTRPVSRSSRAGHNDLGASRAAALSLTSGAFTIGSMERLAEAGIVHLRLVVAKDDASRILEELEKSRAVLNIAHLSDAAVKPRGDLVLCDVAREEVSVVVEQLRRLGIERSGSISIDDIESIISAEARRVALAVQGSPADAVIWEEVEARTSESAQLSFSFIAFMILATLIAAVGILTDSQILIIGAMVVGPEFGPLAGLCVALVQRRLTLARRSATALLVDSHLPLPSQLLQS
jgi:hypothetical protein